MSLSFHCVLMALKNFLQELKKHQLQSLLLHYLKILIYDVSLGEGQ